MDQPVVDMVVIVERMHLRFVGQPSERGGKHDPVVILHKDRPAAPLHIARIAEPPGIKKRLPLH